MLITLLCTVVELITFQTEKAKLMSGTLSRVSSSSISTAEDQSRSQSGKKKMIKQTYTICMLMDILTISINLREWL